MTDTDTDGRVKILGMLSPLSVATDDSGNVTVTLTQCSIRNIPLSKEFTKAREAKPQKYEKHPTIRRARRAIPDELDENPRYKSRVVPATVSANSFSEAVEELYDLATAKENVVLYHSEQDAGWGNSPVPVTSIFTAKSKGKNVVWEALPKTRQDPILALR